MKLVAKQAVQNEDEVQLVASGLLNTGNGDVTGRFALRKKLLLSEKPASSWVDLGATYTAPGNALVYGSTAKKKVALSADGYLTLAAKGSVSFGSGALPGRTRTMRGGRRLRDAPPYAVAANFELCQRLMDVTPNQDIKLKLGYDAATRNFYGQVRENLWTLNVDFRGRWQLLYDM